MAATILTSNYGKSSKELIEFVTQLGALGAHIDLELPRIVAIGNQSAGKSSLVEAISGISVPRDAGTCTRCPMECRLVQSSDRWSCQIKIRWEYKADNVTRHEEVQEVKFGPLLTDKKDVEPMLRRAQAAILNPKIRFSAFTDMSETDLKATAETHGKEALLFSRNVVCMELAGPELVDLSFVDLPGLIQNADAEIVKLVEDLVRSYIEGNSSVILVTLPMSDDIENQKAARLAKEVDPSGSRTIGVMTKPDMLTSGSTKARDLWHDVLEGRRHTLLHGYYCTRQPDDAERSNGISAADARKAETSFFKNTAPWSSSMQQSRLGTANLVQSITKLLTKIIREALPDLLDKVASQLDECNTELQKLPPAILTEPTAFVVDIVTKFSENFSQWVHGSPTSTELVQSTRRTYGAFKDAIRASSPPFAPYKNAAHAPSNISEYVKLGPQDRSAASRKSMSTIMYLDDVRDHISTCITRELPGNVPYAAKLSLLQAFQRSWEQIVLRCFEDVQEAFKKFTTHLISTHFKRYGNLEAVVRPVLMELISGHADNTVKQLRLVLELETSPYTQNHHYFTECRDKWLAKYKDARAGKGTAERITPAAPASQPNVPLSLFSFGPSSAQTPSPFGAPVWSTKATPKPQESSNRKNHLAAPKDAGSSPAKEDYDPPATPSTSASSSSATIDDNAAKPKDAVKHVLAELTKLGYSGITEEDLGKLNPPDIYEDELQVMAEVRAYFQVAYKRIIDYVPLMIDHQFLYALQKALQRALFEQLGLGTANASERCTLYLAEDPAIASMREELRSKKKRLESVQRALFSFGL